MGVFTTTGLTASVGGKITAGTYWNGQVDALIDGFQAGTSYTPTLGGTSWSLGNGTVSGTYTQIGKQVFFNSTVTFGSTSGYGSGSLTISLPATPVATHIGHCRAFDTSAGTSYGGELIISTAGTATPLVTPAAAGGSSRGLISTVPFTWATGDSVTITGYFEAA